MGKEHKLIRKFIVEVPGGEEITYFSIEEARFRFRREIDGRPDNIVTSPADYKKLLSDPANKLSFLDPKTFMGMKIIVDPNLEDGEWKLVKEEAKTYAIE